MLSSVVLPAAGDFRCMLRDRQGEKQSQPVTCKAARLSKASFAMLQARLAPTAERLSRAEDPYIRYALKALTDVVVETLGQLFADVRPFPYTSTALTGLSLALQPLCTGIIASLRNGNLCHALSCSMHIARLHSRSRNGVDMRLLTLAQW